MITRLINDFSRISNNDPDKVFEFIMDFDAMDGMEFLCAEHGINIMLSIPGHVFVSILTLSNTDYDHCIYIMPRQIIESLRDYPEICSEYLEFFERLINKNVHHDLDIPAMTHCYADVIKVFNCTELLQQYFASMVSRIKFGI